MSDNTSFINNISKIEIKNDGSYIVMKNNMPYHIPNNEEYKKEYEIIKKYIDENNIEVTEYVEPVFQIIDTNSEEFIRTKRDNLLHDADILLLKYQEQAALGIIAENQEYYNALLQYKQNLRDITKQLDFPNNVIFPILPEYV